MTHAFQLPFPSECYENNAFEKSLKDITILQKFAKCEVKAARCGNFVIFLPLRFSVKSNLKDFKVSKTAILTSLEALNFDVSEFVQFLKAQFYQNSKSKVSKAV